MNHLRSAGRAVLGQRTTDAVITALATAAARWLPPESPWRARAAADAPATTGFSVPMVQQAIDLTFGALTATALTAMVDRELGGPRVLDDFQQHGPTQTRAFGPGLITHILAGNIPAPGINSLCTGLLLRAANLVKPSAADPVFPGLFAESLREVDPLLGSLVAICPWSREQADVTRAALTKADAVVVYGDDHTIAHFRQRTPPATRFLGYGHKMSLAVVPREVLVAGNLEALAAAAAFDASVYDQQGCLSPHVFYVEERGEIAPR
ncbi:hypothetical protein HQ590_07655, partial [bacterium]|nr:hypothetical protein [bacterium]